MRILSKFESNIDVVKECLNTLIVLMTQHPDLLDDEGVSMIIKFLDNQRDLDVLKLILKWTEECCTLHEMNRQKIFGADILGHLKVLLHDPSSIMLREVLAVLRALVLDDDVRVEFGRAHEHARAIASDTLCAITGLLEKFKHDNAVINDLLLTLSSLLVRTEFCKKVEDAGGIQIIHEAMNDFKDNDKIVKQCLKVLKALAGNDECKVHIIQRGIAPDIVLVMHQHQKNAQTVIFGLACIAALTLRSPDNSKALFEAGAPDVIVQVLRIHGNNEILQKNGSWAIRNMVSRSRYQSEKFLELGAEELLKAAMMKFKTSQYDIKAALRDLGCDVQLKEEWTGKGGKLNTEAKK
ncbi:Armadillo repeat containing protein [Oryctes borbonicus]|uniref:Armadillo repeat containing protein n=1 Tax=Oryctes borbonicus TaxID=1629725 RepID=A0A0T6AVQ1_9SCAR|nr:Armadillo repeat containing protein [Oryctes borbonicus]